MLHDYTHTVPPRVPYSSHPCSRSSVQIKHANRRIVYPFRLFPVISGGFAVRTLFACRIGKIKRPAAIVSVPGAGRNNPLGTFVSLLKPKTQSYADATLFPRRRFPRSGMKGSASSCPESRSSHLPRFGLLNPVRLPPVPRREHRCRTSRTRRPLFAPTLRGTTSGTASACREQG